MCCPVCGSIQSKLVAKQADLRHSFPVESEVRRCASCQTLFTWPRLFPDDLARAYPPDYGAYSDVGKVRNLLKKARARAKSVPWRLFDGVLGFIRKAQYLAVVASGLKSSVAGWVCGAARLAATPRRGGRLPVSPIRHHGVEFEAGGVF
ncbi:MAG: hypothetical protein Kow0069_24210 [Promethearchaeota archaeon]